jgi:1-phosphofructokinase family hexose kinase
MIRVVGANPALDRISVWPPVRLGQVNRASEVTVVAGGKGLNVAKAAVRLGSQATAYGFLGGEVGEAVGTLMGDAGVIDRHTDVTAGTRVCFIVVEPGSGRTTVLNEPGPDVSDEEAARLLASLREDCRPGDLLILSGSLPDSVDPGVAAQVIAIGRGAGARTILDIHGASLRAAIEARPWMLKCNRDELVGLIDGSGDPSAAEPPDGVRLSEVAATMTALLGDGIEVVVVTLGPRGALLADAAGVLRAMAPRILPVNPTGSGDLLLAGLAVGIERGQPARDALALGVACGTAGATHLTPELPTGFVPDEWLPRIRLRPMSVALGT